MPEFVPDCRAHPVGSELDVAHSLPIGAHLSVPLYVSDGSLFGTLCWFKREPDYQLDERDLALLRLVAVVVSTFIERHLSGDNRKDILLKRLKGPL
jgi:GAF domain-containing protein